MIINIIDAHPLLSLRSDNILGVVLSYSLALFFTAALMIKADISSDATDDERLFGILLVIILASGPLCILAQVTHATFRGIRYAKERKEKKKAKKEKKKAQKEAREKKNQLKEFERLPDNMEVLLDEFLHDPELGGDSVSSTMGSNEEEKDERTLHSSESGGSDDDNEVDLIDLDKHFEAHLARARGVPTKGKRTSDGGSSSDDSDDDDAESAQRRPTRSERSSESFSATEVAQKVLASSKSAKEADRVKKLTVRGNLSAEGMLKLQALLEAKSNKEAEARRKAEEAEVVKETERLTFLMTKGNIKPREVAEVQGLVRRAQQRSSAVGRSAVPPRPEVRFSHQKHCFSCRLLPVTHAFSRSHNHASFVRGISPEKRLFFSRPLACRSFGPSLKRWA